MLRKLSIVTIFLIMSIGVFAQDYLIDWWVTGSGGGASQSTNYQVNGTIGQPVVGVASSANYIVEAGFWVGAGGPAGIAYVPGDANMINGIWPPQVIGSDVTYLVSYFRGINPPCLLDGFYCAADVNGDCSIIGSDVTKLVTYFRGLTGLSYCPDHVPLWLTPEECPSSAPAGWPGCEAGAMISSAQDNSNDTK
jgi:hypothetical protein